MERVKARLTFLPKKTTELPGHALSQDPYNQSTQPQHFFQELNKCLLDKIFTYLITHGKVFQTTVPLWGETLNTAWEFHHRTFGPKEWWLMCKYLWKYNISWLRNYTTTQQQQQQQQLYLYTTLVKYLLLLSKFLTQKFCYFCKEGVFPRLKPGQSVSAELLIMLFKVVPHVTTFDETMVYDHSVESYWVVLSCYCQLFVHHFLKTSHGCLFSLRGSSCVLHYGTVNCCTLSSWLWKGYWNPCVYYSTTHIYVNCTDAFHRLRRRVDR